MTELETMKLRELIAAGMSDQDIALLMHYSKRHISRMRLCCGIRLQKGRPTITNRQIVWIKELRQLEVSYAEIGRRLGIDRRTVIKYGRPANA